LATAVSVPETLREGLTLTVLSDEGELVEVMLAWEEITVASLFTAVVVAVVAMLADPRKRATDNALAVLVIVALIADIKIFFLESGAEEVEVLVLAEIVAATLLFGEAPKATAREGVADHPALGVALTAAMTAVGMVGAVNLLDAVAEIPALKATPKLMGK
jgi:hypothetical protein